MCRDSLTILTVKIPAGVCVCVPVHEIAHEAVFIVAAYSSLLVIAVDIDIDNGMRMIFTEDSQ